MNKKILSCLLLVLSNPDPSFSQQARFESGEKDDFFLTHAVKDFGYVFTSPFRADERDGVQLLAASALAAGLMFTLDEPFDEEYGVENRRHPLAIPRAMARLGNLYDRVGTNLFVVGASGTAFAAGLIVDDPKLKKTAGLMVESVLFSKAITFVAKRTFGRTRPYANRGARDFRVLNFKNKRENHSFPSGHSSSAFAIMTVLAKQYDTWWVKAPAYGLAASVGFQRVDSRSHWLSDVVVGGLLGYVVGSSLVDRHAGNGAFRLPVVPSVSPGRKVLGMEFRF